MTGYPAPRPQLLPGRTETTLTGPRTLSLLIAALDVVVYAAREDPDPNILTFLVVLAFPLVLIWFSDALGSFRGYVGKGGYIDKETPGCLVAATGWIFLGVITLSVLFGVP